MSDASKTREQLLNELAEMRRRIAKLEVLEVERKERTTELQWEITERRRAEEVLRASELQYRTTIDSLDDVIHIVDTDLRLTLFNTTFMQWCQQLGRETADVIGRTPFEVFPFLPDRVRDEYHQVFETGETLVTKESIELEGKEIITETRKLPIFEDSSVVWVITIVRDITGRVRAEEEVQRRAAQAALIYEVGRRVSGELELDALLSGIVTAVCDAFGYYSAMLMLLDEQAERLTLQFIAGGYAGVFSHDLSIAVGEGMIGYAAATGETQVSGDVSQDPHYVRKAQEETRSELAVPIESGQQVIGVLDLQSHEFEAFDETDVVAMETLSTQIGTAIENARLLQDTRAHVEELAVLNELGQALTTRLDVEQVLDEAYRGASRLMDTSNFYIVLYNPDKEEEITFSLDVVEGEIREPYVTWPAGRGLAEYVIHNRTPLLIEANLPERLKEMGIELAGRAALSWVGVPLVIGDRVLGMMAAVQGHTTSRAYDEHDRDLLLSIASQTAIALQNTYLFEETQRRVTQLALINDVGGKIAAVLGLDGVMDRAAHLAQESFGYHHVALFTVDRERDEMVMRARAGDFAPLFPLDHRLRLGQGMVGWVGLYGKRLLANDVEAELRYVNLYPDVIPTRSELSVPIRVGQEVMGVLDVQSPRRDAFDENDVMVIETLADQVAVAIDNARLYEAIQQELVERVRAEEAVRQRNRELALLNRASQALSATLDLDQVLATVLEEMCHLLDVVAGSIWLVEPPFPVPPGKGRGGGLVCRHVIGPGSGIVRGWRLAPGEGVAGWVARSGESLIVPDARTDERHFDGVDRQIGMETRSILSVPLHVKQEVVGVLQMVDTDAGRFGPADLALVEPLAASASIAIENAHLYQELLSHAEQLEQRVQERTAELQDQYARLDAILSSTADGIVVTDEEGNVIQANPVAQAWLTQTLSPEEAGRLRETVQRVATQAGEQPIEMLELTGLDLELNSALISEPKFALPSAPAFRHRPEEPVLGKTAEEEEALRHRPEEPMLGKPAAVVAIHDVSHLKALDRMKTRFVTNISHELRTPITTIKLYAHLMQQQPEKWKQHLETLAWEADHQARLVEDILQVSRIDAGRLEMKPRLISLNELTRAVVASRQVLAQERGLTLEHRSMLRRERLAERSDFGEAPVSSAEPLSRTARPSRRAVEPLMVLVDPERMKQVLDNLVGNGIRYTPEGGTVVVSTGTKEAEGRMWATVTVTDTGIGIPAEELPHIFERFFRGVEPRAMQLTGTGLGLSIAKEIVELHGGRVTVESPSTGSGQAPSTLWLRSGQVPSTEFVPSEAEGAEGPKAGEQGIGSTFTVWLPLAVG